MSENEEKKDAYDIKFDQMCEKLQDCQSEKNLNSCFKCNEIFECQTRKDFVDSAYDSMSKGNVGGFEF
ncbi:MAG: hypothetical protein K5978_00570 [Campylobacter sp.]|nr:hypothetical protein [Campylobacter sp.]